MRLGAKACCQQQATVARLVASGLRGLDQLLNLAAGEVLALGGNSPRLLLLTPRFSDFRPLIALSIAGLMTETHLPKDGRA
jgi:hypothetical protein